MADKFSLKDVPAYVQLGAIALAVFAYLTHKKSKRANAPTGSMQAGNPSYARGRRTYSPVQNRTDGML